MASCVDLGIFFTCLGTVAGPGVNDDRGHGLVTASNKCRMRFSYWRESFEELRLWSEHGDRHWECG